MMNKKQLAINMTATVVNFIVTFAISFFLSPYIIREVGREAYGFLSLGNQFVSYASIVTAALNSMASRFVTINIHKRDTEAQNRYFSSVVFANIVLALVLLVPCVCFVFFMEHVISVPQDIIWDVKTLWLFLFVNFLVGIVTNAYSIATFATNNIYLNSIRTIESSVLRCIILVGMFAILQPSIWFLGLASLVCTLYTVVFNVKYTKKLLPDIQCKRKFFDINCVKELLASGIWNAFVQLAGVLNNGLDLLITNLFIGASAMGTFSITKTIPTVLISVFGLFRNTFLPEMTRNYALDRKDKMLENMSLCSNVLSMIGAVVLGILLVNGDVFYRLWVPSENATELHIITIISLLLYVLNVSLSPVIEIITIANKVRFTAIAYFVIGVLNVLIVIPLLKWVDAGKIYISFLSNDIVKVLIISLVSKILNGLHDVVVLPIYAARCLKIKWYSFYPLLWKSILATAAVCVVAFTMRNAINMESWTMFLLGSGITAIVGVVGAAVILLGRRQCTEIVKKFVLVIKRKDNKKR